jgi:hypothetical protein
VSFLWILSGHIWEAIEKIKKPLDRSTQMSEASQSGVREAAVSKMRGLEAVETGSVLKSLLSSFFIFFFSIF